MSTMFDPETPALVRFPITREQHDGDRAAWPWLPGTILAQVGPDEWDVMVTARELATLDDGSPAPGGAHWGDLCYPCCYRDSTELRRA